MTISITASDCTHIGNGSIVDFDVKDGANGIYFAAASELVVTLRSGGTVTPQTLGTHYAVTGAGSANGRVIFFVAPASGVVVQIERRTPRTQSLELSNAGAFNPDAIEAALDKLTRITQETSGGASGGITSWDAEGSRIENVGTPDADTDAANKAYVLSVTGAGSAAAAAASASEAAASAAAAEAALEELNATAGVTSVNTRSGTVTLSSSDLAMSATKRVVARNSAGSGASEEVSLSQLLDWIGSAAEGDLIVRGETAWGRLAAGTAGHVLTANGAGEVPSYQAPASSGGSSFPPGTLMLFVQTTAPTGWTKQTTHNDKALRVVSGTAGSGGSVGFTTAMVNALNTGATTLNSTQMPAHTHSGGAGGIRYVDAGENALAPVLNSSGTTGSTGGGGSHNHTYQLNVAYVDVIICAKD